MTTSTVDLARIFSAVQKELAKNQESLNQADSLNHDHGDNMVKTFEVITKAVRKKKGADAAEQLRYASQALSAASTSGSAKVYSQGLATAATKFEGKQVTRENALELITALMGSGQQTQAAQQAPAPPAPAAPEDPLAGLLGGLMGGGQQSQPSQQPQAAADPLAGLLGGLMGGGQQSQAPGQDPLGSMAGQLLGGLMGGGQQAGSSQAPASQGGFDAGDLLQIGMAFMQAQQKGAKPVEALVSAVLSNSALGNSAHRQESGQMIISTILKMLQGSGKK